MLIRLATEWHCYATQKYFMKSALDLLITNSFKLKRSTNVIYFLFLVWFYQSHLSSSNCWHKGNLALFLAYFLAIFWHMPGFISGMCQKFYCTILCSQISPKFLAYYRAIIPLWLGTRLGTYFSRDVASHSTSRKTLLCSQKLMPELNFYCSQDSPPEFYFYVARIPRQKFNSMQPGFPARN